MDHSSLRKGMQVKEGNRGIAGASGSSEQATTNVGDLLKMMGTLQNAVIMLQTTVAELVPTVTILGTTVTTLGTTVAELVPSVTILQSTVTTLQAHVGDSLPKPKVVQEEIHAAGLDGGNRTNTNTERELHLKFSEEPNDAVTGKEIRGKRGDSLRLGIFDDTEQIIQIDANVEIFTLKSDNDNEENWSSEAFNSRIISGKNKKEPHFTKPCRVHLTKGIGVITDAKLANDKSWLKPYRCRLGARVVWCPSATNVREGWTMPFNVTESRKELYKKNGPPLLSDKVWKLKNIGKGGARCDRLEKEKISTVKEFLIRLSVAENHLREIIEQPDAPKKKKQQFNDADWKATVAHALTCNINDKNLGVYSDSSEPNMRVVFNVVGWVQGVIFYDHYVPIDLISEADEKRCAEELMRSAFENRDNITYYKNEETLATQFSNKKKRKRENLVLDNVKNLGVTNPPHPVNEPNPDEEQRVGGGGVGVAITYGTEGASSSCNRPSGDANNANAPLDPNINSLEPTSSMERSSHRDCNRSDFGGQCKVKDIPVTSPLPPGTCEQSPLDEPSPPDQERGGREGGAVDVGSGQQQCTSEEAPELSASAIPQEEEDDCMINVDDYMDKDLDEKEEDIEDYTYYINNIPQEDSTIRLYNFGDLNTSIQDRVLDARQPPSEAPELPPYATNQLLEDTSLTMPPESHDYNHASSNSHLAAGFFVQDLDKDLADVPQMNPSSPQLQANDFCFFTDFVDTRLTMPPESHDYNHASSNSHLPAVSLVQDLDKDLADVPQMNPSSPQHQVNYFCFTGVLEDTSLTMPPESASSNSHLPTVSFVRDLDKDLADVPQLNPSLNDNPFALSVLQDCFFPKLG